MISSFKRVKDKRNVDILEEKRMSTYSKTLKILENKCGKNRDNVISLATISRELNHKGQPMPSVRNVNAYYEDGTFFIVTYGKSNKMLEIEMNQEVAFSVDRRNIFGSGVAENLGWVLDPKNVELRSKLRRVFAKWYDEANNELDENFCYTAIRIKKITIVTGHGPTTKRYDLDLENQIEVDEIKEMLQRNAYYFDFCGKDAIDKGRDFIFNFLKNNDINLQKYKKPLYILGSYDLNQEKNDTFKFKLFVVAPPNSMFKENPEITTLFGGYVARRFTTYANLEKSTEDFKVFYTDHEQYDMCSNEYFEQYLLDKNKFNSNTQILQILSLKVRDL